MEMNVGREVAALPRTTVRQLGRKYAEVFGEDTSGRNKAWSVKRIVWRLQARAAALADAADLRMKPPPMKEAPTSREATPVQGLRFQADDRLPPATVRTRKYKGGVLHVKVRPDGFGYEGVAYAPLGAAAEQTTGSHCNGFLFFRLAGKGGVA